MSPTPIENAVANSSFFSGLAAESIGFLVTTAQVRSLEAGQVLFQSGGRARQFFLVTEGRVSLEVAAIEGPALELQNLGPGEVTGWSWLIKPNRWTFQARATTPATVVQFDGTAVLARCEGDPKFGYELLKRFSELMSERLQFARQRMMEEWKPAGFA
jgi:CRP/FNR family transcriptional regulator, cyclic AMP receptor protein